MKETRPTIALSAFIAVLCTAGSALADPNGAVWIEIPIVDSPDDPADLTGYRSFDLYVFVETGDVIDSADFGFGNTGLFSSQSVFQHQFGNDLERSDLLADFFPDVVYDTFVALGNLDGPNGAIQMAIPLDTSNPANISAAWFHAASSPPAGPGGGVYPDGHFFPLNNAVWIARFTIASTTDYEEPMSLLVETISGECHVTGTGPNGDFGSAFDLSDGVVRVPSPYPLSGAPMPLPEFSMLSPVSPATLQSANYVVLDWEPITGAVQYHIRVTTDSRHWDNLIAENIPATDSFTIPAGALAPCTTYYWHVFGNNSFDRHPASNWRDGAFTTSITGDVNLDGAVDTADLGVLLAVFQTPDPNADLNGDGIVDTADLGLLLANFGLSCN